MTIDEGIDLVDTILRLRREVAGLARSIDVTSASFLVEWRAALEELQGRLDQLAALEACIDPVLAAGERITLLEYRAWLTKWARVDEDKDEDGHPAPVTAPARALHPSVH